MENIYVRFLNKLEEIEYKSIQWGYTAGTLSEDELYDEADSFLELSNNNDLDSEELVEYLISEKLIFQVNTLQGEGFRTRFGETLFLLTNLRQIFNKNKWKESPQLVSDFRVNLQKRFYPKREVNPSYLLQDKNHLNLTSLQKNIWKVLTDGFLLAKFQCNATDELLKDTSIYNGVIVTAGTGSGKTLSFYLPALLKIVDSIDKDNSNWTRVIAAYPRVELLRDQFSEAIQQSLSISKTLKENNKRPIRIGALYGAIPNRASIEELRNKGWKRNVQNTGWICPIINCPYTNTELLWLDSDINQNIERLVPNTDVEGAITLSSEYIVLTRERLIKETPDLLFITLEMINKRLSDSKVNRLFGIRKRKDQKPFLMLLDEVHTYTGTTGAQASMVLKRWKKALISPVKFVGLSATLNEAERFFSELTGVYENKVIEITPQSDEMIEEGSEYQIILKGNPVNKTSLLSTTIQTIMLIGRILNPVGSIKKKIFKDIVYGEKVFAFSDDLDVTNRLFDDLKDAEGFDIFNNSDPKSSSLAMLRKKDISTDFKERTINGQNWAMCEEIGHPFDGSDLRSKLKISRTSSQDVGVDTKSSVVVATASLEVGFNDPTVGAVVQHKAPYNWANFLQRKGRAGRKRGTKPFMITTLSDFGRDRVAFNHYEYFFNPIVPIQRLPIYNRYVLKIQATITLFDWLSKMLSINNVWMFNFLSKPMEKLTSKKEEVKKEILYLLNQILDQTSKEHIEFKNYLKYALGLKEYKDVDELFWSAPRSLILEAIPTLIRRLTTNWKLAFPKSQDIDENYIDYLPLPEFITSTLFSDLALPEVKIIVELDKEDLDSHMMPLQQTLREFAPGRISRRFASKRGNLHHWIPISIEVEYQTLEISQYFLKYDFVNTVFHKGEEINIYKPYEINLNKNTIQTISKKSNSILNWYTSFIPMGEPISVYLSKQNSWSKIIEGIEFYTHSHNSNCEIIRYSTGATASISFKGGDTLETDIEFLDKGSLSSIGFSFNVDSMCLKYKIPTLNEISTIGLPSKLKRELKLAWFKHQVIEDTLLPKQITTFEKNWLQEVISSSIIIFSSFKGISLEKSNEILKNDSEDIFKILSEMFNTDSIIKEEETEEDVESKLFITLNELLRDKDIRLRLHDIFTQTVLTDTQEWFVWLRKTLHESFANTLLFACENLTPNQTSLDTLLVDPVELNESGIAEIWLSESSAGGLGVIDELVNIIAQDPTSLFKSISAVTQLSDHELVVNSLEQFIYFIQEDEDLKKLTLNICQTKGHYDRQNLLDKLYIKLSSYGLVLGQSFKVALNTRLLKEGVDSRFFDLIFELIQWRDEFEKNIELSIDLKLFCFVVIRQDFFRNKIESLNLNNDKALIDTANLLSNILWSRSFETRHQNFQAYNPFRQNQFNDPNIVKHFILNDSVKEVDISDIEWKDKTIEILKKYSSCKLKVQKNQFDKFSKDTLAILLAQPLDIDFLQLYIMIDGVEKLKDSIIITLRLREEL